MKFKFIRGSLFINTLIVFIIFFLDRISKSIVINFNQNSLSDELYSSKFLNIQLIWNKGIAFGLFSFDQNSLYNLLTILISLIVLVILYLIFKSKGIAKYALLMIFSGALGNLYDRILYKAVPDIFISIGVIIMIFFEILTNKKKYD